MSNETTWLPIDTYSPEGNEFFWALMSDGYRTVLSVNSMGAQGKLLYLYTHWSPITPPKDLEVTEVTPQDLLDLSGELDQVGWTEEAKTLVAAAKQLDKLNRNG